MVWLSLLCGLAMGQTGSDEPEEIIVFGDGYQRWDDTRWHVKTDMRLPIALVLGRQNQSFQATALQLDAIVHCELDGEPGKVRAQVDCLLEDVGLRSALSSYQQKKSKTTGTAYENGLAILNEVDAKLTGAKLQLRVAPDGRVQGIDLEGLTAKSRAERMMNETITVLVQRLMVGFDMKLRKVNQLNEGAWVEYKAAMMTVPLPVGLKTSLGSSKMVHQLNMYKGKVLVQSIGEMQIAIPKAESGAGAGGDIDESNRGNATVNETILQTMVGTFDGVSIFDPTEGYMLERVWTLSAKANSSGLLTHPLEYDFQGRIAMLGSADKPAVGATGIIAHPMIARPPENMAPWISLQER